MVAIYKLEGLRANRPIGDHPMKLTNDRGLGQGLRGKRQRRDFSGCSKKSTKKGEQARNHRRWEECMHARCTPAGEDGDGTVSNLKCVANVCKFKHNM